MFIFIGLNSSFKSVVGYFLVKNLTAEPQTALCLHVIADVEKLGVAIVHVSTDNHATNTKMYRILKNQYPTGPQLKSFFPNTNVDELEQMIRHPFDENRPLFLSFDPCHLIKNLRNCFLSRQLINDGRKIDFELPRVVLI